MLAGLQAKLLGLGAFALSVFAFLFRFKMVKKQRDKALERASSAEMVVIRQKVTQEREAEMDLEFDGLQTEAKEALQNDEIPEHLRNPRD
jgi:hypothetical protein